MYIPIKKFICQSELDSVLTFDNNFEKHFLLKIMGLLSYTPIF